MSDPLSRLALSLVVVAHDAGKELADCLASAAFASEAIVVDSGSRDDTVEIARRFGARVITQTWLGYGPQKNFAVGQAALGQLDIRRLSLPYLLDLNQQTRETIHLTVRHGLTAVYVEKIDSPEHLRIHSRIGAAVPLYCTAVGKVMLAYMPDWQEREKRLRGHAGPADPKAK